MMKKMNKMKRMGMTVRFGMLSKQCLNFDTNVYEYSTIMLLICVDFLKKII